ncbi:hypothetical protein OSTOST_16759, partial [Ostertagia ostertagi]
MGKGFKLQETEFASRTPETSVSVDHPTENTPVRSQLVQEQPTAPPSTPVVPAYQPMDPRLRETLQKIRTERNSGFVLPVSTSHPCDQMGTGWFSDGTQPSSFQSRLHTLRDQLGTAVPTSTAQLGTAVPTSTAQRTAIPTSTTHRTVPTAQYGTALNTGVEQ